MRDHRKKIRFTVERSAEGWTANELEARDEHGADAIIVHAINYDARVEDNEVTVYTMDGATGTMIADEKLFRAWAMMAQGLARSPGLRIEARNMAREARKAAQKLVIEGQVAAPWTPPKPSE